MRAFTYHILGMAVMLAAFWLAARLVVPWVQRQGFGESSWHVPVAGFVIMAAPVWGLLLFELIAGRALGWGFSVVRRAESPREYWGWIAFHTCFLLILAVAIYQCSFGRP
ncbi:MAG TPA: hypothetical protein VNO52_07470 [Methylomirabilota bacterium]|nr:hypothetical protein [Methylomirabilota bacterium]